MGPNAMPRTLDELKAFLAGDTPPADLAEPLQALWQDSKGNWAKAHEIAQSIPDWKGAWVHAIYHRSRLIFAKYLESNSTVRGE